MISVLCPTRLRPTALTRSLTSLRARSGSELEVLLAVDSDDTTDYTGFGAEVWCSVRRGYANLHSYYNRLAEFARGDWLLLWNDDALMATDKWDEIVRSYKPNVVLSPSTVHAPLCTFPIIPRRFVDAIGHFSLNAHCDTWWQEIAEHLGVLVWPPIEVRHDRADITGENRDEVFAQREYQTARFDELRPERLKDAAVISGLLFP